MSWSHRDVLIAILTEKSKSCELRIPSTDLTLSVELPQFVADPDKTVDA